MQPITVLANQIPQQPTVLQRHQRHVRRRRDRLLHVQKPTRQLGIPGPTKPRERHERGRGRTLEGLTNLQRIARHKRPLAPLRAQRPRALGPAEIRNARRRRDARAGEDDEVRRGADLLREGSGFARERGGRVVGLGEGDFGGQVGHGWELLRVGEEEGGRGPSR